MGRSRDKRRRRKKAVKQAAAEKPRAARKPTGSAKQGAAGKRSGSAKRAPLVPWRRQMGEVLDTLRTWSADNYGAALDAYLGHVFGEASADGRPEDLQRARDDCICAPGSAGEGLSILRVFCDQVTEVDPDLRAQARRWETERHRGVFVVQTGAADRLGLWDPLEGAPLTLHLLEKLGGTALRLARPGAVATACYQPWMARVVAVETPEIFTDARALEMFRQETSSSGARWHEPPPPAPARSRAASSSAP